MLSRRPCRTRSPALCIALACALALKLAGELSSLLHLRDHQQTELKRSALLLRGELWPLLARAHRRRRPRRRSPRRSRSCSRCASAVSGLDVALALLLLFALALAGELLERLLFFAAVSAPKMPGALR